MVLCRISTQVFVKPVINIVGKKTIKSETSTSGKIIVGDENGDYDEHTDYEMGTPKSKS